MIKAFSHLSQSSFQQRKAALVPTAYRATATSTGPKKSVLGLKVENRSFGTQMQQQEVASTELMDARREAHQVRHDIPRGKNRVPYNINVGDTLHGFTVKEKEAIKAFDVVAYKLEHAATGAQWLHLDSSDTDNVFAVMFRTPPDDHTGKPHILEHLALCGSRHYPVRDPFFNMIKRSLNTFMNAWTGSDFTMYPFSTQNAQDYRNLLSVYTDAAFLPNLNYLDFRQEGHRLEFTDPEDPASGLKFQGVVYNEMKGAMSDPDGAFAHRLNEGLFQKSQYRFNSGGEPKHITDLQYQELVDFHKMYYHPSNATFFSYGDLDFAEHLKFVEEQVIRPSFERNTALQSELALDAKLASPIYREENFQPDLMSPAETQSKLGLAFLCDFLPAEEPYEAFCLQILSQLLLTGPNAPFYKSVIEQGKAPQFCPAAGFDHTTRQATFTLGVQGVSEKEFKGLEEVLFQTLADAKKGGIAKDLFEQVLHEVEFSTKATKSHAGLMYISGMIPYALHGGDPLALFRINEFSARIREDFAKGDLFESLIEKHLLKNPHYLRMLYTPDGDKAGREERADKQHLAALDAALSEDEKKTIVKETKALKKHQEALQNAHVLPTVALADIPRNIEFTDSEVKYVGNVKTHFYEQPTNGITYVRIKADLKSLPAHLRLFLPMFSETLSKIGTKNYRYDAFNNRMLSCSSGLSVDIDRYCSAEDHEDLLDRKEQLLISTGFLDRNTDQAFECLEEIIATPNFDEPSNISDLIKMGSIDKANSIGNKGLAYAGSYSASGLKAFARSFEGLRNDIFFCQYAAQVLGTSQPLPLLQDAIHQMTDIASYLFREDNLEIAIHGDRAKFDLIQLKLELLLNSLKKENSRYSERHPALDLLPDDEFPGKQTFYKNFFKTPLQVNNCCESMVGPTNTNVDDYGALLVLQQLLTHEFLLPSIREKGGAYGAGCRVSESGIIKFYSYRDPNVTGTYENFERAISSVIDGQFSDGQITEAKLLAFQGLDAVVNPSLKGLVQFTRGYTDEHKMQMRLRALEVTKDDLVYVAQKYMISSIENDTTSRVVFGSQQTKFDGLESDGWSIYNPIDFLSYKYFEQWNEANKE